MTVKLDILGGSDWIDGEVLYADDLNDTIKNVDGSLGEVKQFALSLTGATTKANLQTRGWAICDGTDIVTTQGITSADITGNAPDLQDKFIQMSNDETSGTTGGSATHNHKLPFGLADTIGAGDTYTDSAYGTTTNASFTRHNEASMTLGVSRPRLLSETVNSKPPFYELAFFIKVKI